MMKRGIKTQVEREELVGRLLTGLPAQIISNGIAHAGRIEKFSGNIMTFLIPVVKDFSPQMIMMVHGEVPSGELYDLTCEFQWFFRISQDDKRLLLGLEITGPSEINFKM